MKRKALSVLMLFALSSNAQDFEFEQVAPFSPAPSTIVSLPNLRNSPDNAFLDVDNDGDLDLIISGETNLGQKITKLYLNDLTYGFVESTINTFTGLYYCTISYGDIDSDGDLDLFIAGYNTSSSRVSNIYKNDGTGLFTVQATSIVAVGRCDSELVDVDNDGDLDLIVIGLATTGPSSNLYLNDGLGNFTISAVSYFEESSNGSISVADIDGDLDIDVFISGTNSNGKFSNLYKNNGVGVFTETATSVSSVDQSASVFVDIDGDLDKDLIVTGLNATNMQVTEIHINSGSGNFTLSPNQNILSISTSTLSAVDVDNDNDMDIFITGIINGAILTNFYINDGNGIYSLSTLNEFPTVIRNSVSFADIDADGDEDLLYAGTLYVGSSTNANGVTCFYSNDGNGLFSKVTGSTFNGVSYSTSDFGDVDGDNDADVIISGYSSLGRVTTLYLNDGSGNYQVSSTSTFEQVYKGTVRFLDIDGDLDLDIILTGNNNLNVPVTKIYNNDGSGNFTLNTSSSLTGVQSSAFDYSDVDNDGDLDILLIGQNLSGSIVASLYLNDGSGVFTISSGTSFTGIKYGATEFGDIDGDGDEDLVIAGTLSNNTASTKFYINDGTGNFSLQVGSVPEALLDGDATFADTDNDGDLDFFISGNQGGMKLYINDGIGNYTYDLSNFSSFYSFGSARYGRVLFSDKNNSVNQLLLVVGESISSLHSRQANLYKNDGLGSFTLISSTNFDGTYLNSANFEDIDGDGDPDILITGKNSYDNLVAKLYRNITCYPTYGIDTNNVCGSFVWINGVTYTENNYTAIDTILNGATNGCDSIITLNLTIQDNESIDYISACDSLTWIDGVTYFSSTTTPSSIQTNIFGCDSIVTLNLIVTSLDASVVVNGQDIVCNDNDVSYQWVNCLEGYSEINNSVNQTFSVTENGEYAVVIEQNTCVDTSVCTLIEGIGFEEMEINQTINIYPTHTSDVLFIECSEFMNIQIEVLNLQGELVISTNKIQAKKYKLNLDLSSGIYIVRVITDDFIKGVRIVFEE